MPFLWQVGSMAEDASQPAKVDAVTPPEQYRPWTAPPTGLPVVVVSAVTELFDDGLPDPRGCQYREIKIQEFGLRPVDTHGWVLPEAEGTPNRAIAWNGVIYQVAEVGAPADLRADFAKMAAKRDRRFRGNRSDWSDWDSVAADSELPIKAAFLLRSGEGALAEDLWTAGYSDDAKAKAADPFADMARLWLSRWYNTAADAYLRGDYARAATVCHSLSPVVAKVKAAAAGRGIADPWPDKEGGEYLWQLPVLEAESQRRSTAAPYTPALEERGSLPPAEKIARLIRDLETVSVHQKMNPGETEVFDDPTVQALSKAGDEAVEPLLRCLREDDRLTCSRYTHHMDFGGPVIPVYEAAYTALFRMLNVSFPLFEGDRGEPRQRSIRHLSREERGALAAKLEAAWRKDHALAPDDKAYRTLQDDKAGAQAWFRAVDEIVQPADGTFTAYRVARPPVGSYSIRSPDKPFTPRGEALRSRTDPSVTQLMIRRFDQLVRQPYDEDISRAVVDQNALGKFLLSLAAWDGSHCLPELRSAQRELAARYADHPAIFNEATLVTLYERRFDLGDRTALEDYAAYLEESKPEQLSDNLEGAAASFRFLWRHPDEAAFRHAADTMFGAPGSPCVPLLNEEGQRQLGLSSLLRTPLVGMPEFRKELVRGLSDTTKAGTATLYDNGNVGGIPNGNSRFYRLDLLAPAAGTKVDYRVCDAYADLLSQLDGFPECRTYWPVAERDRAVAACQEFLRRYGDHFRYRPGDRDTRDSAGRLAHIHFPKLDRPAMAEDVAQGRAIFSLPGETRVCRLPEVPLYAHRPGRKADPVPALTTYADGTSKDTIQYVTEGYVWQAEETLVDGKWERFYGFVGRYQLEKVPAAQIRFDNRGEGDHPYERVTAEITGRIESPVNRHDGEEINRSFASRDFVPLGAPLPLTVKIRNGSGLDQPVPTGLLLPAGATKVLPPGIRLSLSYSEKIPPKVQRFGERQFDYGKWHDLPLRPEIGPPANQAQAQTLAPAQELTVLSVDLRDYFETNCPGSYRVRVFFPWQGHQEGESNDIIFTVAEPAR